jgi:hypothetical protein
MPTSKSRTGKKSRGRPRKDPTSIHLTLLPEQLGALDGWIDGQADKPSRPEAIRRLLTHALASRVRTGRSGKETTREASDMAARAVEHLSDRSVPAEEQARRKRALIKGPKEFRDIRGDQPVAKK